MEVWHGDVIRADGKIFTHDLHLGCMRPSSQPNLSRKSELHFLSWVDPSRIPLHLAASLPLAVWTDDQATEDFFSQSLVYGNNQDVGIEDNASQISNSWLHRKCLQSDYGILLGVKTSSEDVIQHVPKVTELLLYAVLASWADRGSRLPTPPRSSSPSQISNVNDLSKNLVPEINIYALPLSSGLSCSTGHFRRLGSPSPESLEDGQACLPELSWIGDADSLAVPLKQSRLSALFDDVAEQRRKTRRRGGEGISQAMASLERPQSQQSQPISTHVRENTKETSLSSSLVFPYDESPRPVLSRSSSTASAGPSRPTSRRETLAKGRRSSLRRVTSIASMTSGTSAPEELESIESQNKSALSRVIMAAMRIYGLQQKKKPERQREMSEVPNTLTDSQHANTVPDPDDEYKSIYHQTLRTATLAFRKDIVRARIGQEDMRDVVDRLLTILCIDPLGRNANNEHNPFSSGETCQTRPD